MSNPYIEKQITKIINEDGIEFPKNIALASAWIIANFKGVNIKIFDVQGSSSLCDYNIIASAQNVTQARSMVDELSPNLKKNGQEILSVEGLTDAEWILVDAGDVIIHLFQETARDIFDLDTLWQGYPQVQIPEEYYFSNPSQEVKKEDSNTNYF